MNGDQDIHVQEEQIQTDVGDDEETSVNDQDEAADEESEEQDETTSSEEDEGSEGDQDTDEDTPVEEEPTEDEEGEKPSEIDPEKTYQIGEDEYTGEDLKAMVETLDRAQEVADSYAGLEELFKSEPVNVILDMIASAKLDVSLVDNNTGDELERVEPSEADKLAADRKKLEEEQQRIEMQKEIQGYTSEFDSVLTKYGLKVPEAEMRKENSTHPVVQAFDLFVARRKAGRNVAFEETLRSMAPQLLKSKNSDKEGNENKHKRKKPKTPEELENLPEEERLELLYGDKVFKAGE